MSFKKQFLIIFSSVFILLISGLITFYNILQNEKAIAESELKRYESYLLADELRQSSDDLTRMARTYTVTSDSKFRQYFDKILDIRDGKAPRPNNYSGIYWDFVTATGVYPSSPADKQVSLETLMNEKDFTRDEFNSLKESKNRSDSLVKLETQAMNAMIGLYPNEDGNFTIRKKPDLILAQKIMHSPEYHKIKKEIMEPMQTFFQEVDQRTRQTVSFYRTKGKRLNTLMLSLISLAVLLIFISFVLILFQKGINQKNDMEAWKRKEGWKRKFFYIYTSWPLLTLVVVAFAINLSFFWWTKKVIEEQVHSNLKAELQTIVKTTHKGSINWLEKVEQELESFITLSAFKNNYIQYKSKNLVDKKISHHLFKKDLNHFIKIHQFKNYFLIDKKGNMLSSSQQNLIGKNISKSLPKKMISQFKSHKKTALIFPENLKQKKESLFKNNIFLAGKLVSNKKEEGFLILEIPINGDFSQVIQNGRFKESGESYAFNNEGYLLSESRFNDQLYKIGLLSQGTNSSLSIRVVDPETNLTLHPNINNLDLSQKKLTQMVLNAFQNTRGVTVKPYNDYRGVPVIGAWVWDDEYSIGFATEIDSEEAFLTLHSFEKQANIQLIVNFILLLILTIVFIWNKTLFSEMNEKLQFAYKSIKVQTNRMEDELKLGHQIQMSMVPREFPKHKKFSVHAKLKPARELGGDFYDFFLLNENQLCIVVGDVSGKGVPSALFMAVTKTLIRTVAAKYNCTDKILSEVNKSITLNNPYFMFATIFIAILNLSDGECSYTSAGHHSSYIKKAGGTLINLNKVHGPVTGAVENVQYSKDTVLLKKEDMLIAYTDGITEATDEKDNLYGDEKLETLLKQKTFDSSEVLINTILTSVTDFSKETNQSDDITLMVVKYL